MTAFFRISLFGLLCTSACTGFVFSCPVCGQDAAPDAPDVQSLLEQLRSEKVEEQIEAVVQLGSFGPYAQPAIDPLVELLKTENPSLRYECIVALGHIGPMAHDSADSLTGFLTSDDELLQSAALESLRRFGTASPVAQAQIRRLCQNQNASLAISAVRCLVIIAGADDQLVQTSIPRLVKALGDTRPEVRNEASVTLVEIGPAVVPAVAATLSGNDPRVQLKACEILGQLGADAASTVSALLTRLNNDDELVVRAATTALGKIHAEPAKVLPALNALLKRKSAAVRIVAVRAIADYGPEARDSADLMLNLLSDDSIMLRASAVDALGRTAVARVDVIEALVKALSDGNAQVTLNAANALSHIGTPAVPALVQKLADEDCRRLVIEVLGEIAAGAESAVPALVELLSHIGDDADLRREVFIALASIGPKATGATSAMMKILQDPATADAQAGASYVLARIGEKKALPVLQELIKVATDERVLRSAAWALVTLDPQDAENVKLAMPHLLQATSSETPLVRKEAMTAFTTLGPVAIAALPSLLEHAANDADASVRTQSLHGLAEIQAPAAQALPVAIASLDDPDVKVRNAARYLLGSLGEAAHGTAPLLRESLRRGDELERVLSAWALVHVAPSKENAQAAIPLLLTALQHPNSRVRAEAAITLGTIGAGSKEVRTALEAAQNDEDPIVKNAVVEALKAVTKGR